MRLKLSLVYISIILIWSTTPITITWSTQLAGGEFGVSLRMILALLIVFTLFMFTSSKMFWHQQARRAYLIGGLGIFGGMAPVYWAAEFIPSGWIALLFGFAPIFTAIMESFWVENGFLTRYRFAGMLLGLMGLAVVFASDLSFEEDAKYGVMAIVVAALAHSASAVWVKRVNANIPTLSMVTGSMLVATPLFLITWLYAHPNLGETWSALAHAPMLALASIVYLAIFASLVGFSLFYFGLKHIAATRIALISLMTPILALLIGHYFNAEVLNLNILYGVVIITFGLVIFQFGDKWKLSESKQLKINSAAGAD